MTFAFFNEVNSVYVGYGDLRRLFIKLIPSQSHRILVRFQTIVLRRQVDIKLFILDVIPRVEIVNTTNITI